MRNNPYPKKYDGITIQEYRRRESSGKISYGEMKLKGRICYLNTSNIEPSYFRLYGKGK